MAAAVDVQLVNISINDVPLQVPKGEMIIESVKRLARMGASFRSWLISAMARTTANRTRGEASSNADSMTGIADLSVRAE